MSRQWFGACALLGSLIAADAVAAQTPAIQWTQLSSRRGELPVPGTSKQQTGALVVKVDPQGATDFVLSFRQVAPALVWYRRTGDGWQRYVVEKDFLTVEAGGAAHDVDGDGDMDIVFGNDSQGNRLWWWENPAPNWDPEVPWMRHPIKVDGANQHHDQAFADVKGTGRPQLIFWNQKASTLFLAEIPANPRGAQPWKLETVYAGTAGEGGTAAAYAEGVEVADVDNDGRLDILAGNFWFKRQPDGAFRPIRIGTIGGRIRAAKFRPGAHPQVVIAPGDGSGPLRFYEAKGDPTVAANWVGRDLLERDMVHGHTLEVGDIDGDGKLDIFAAEMAKWTGNPTPADHPDATAWILYGDGTGNFRRTEMRKGDGWHEGKLGDFDGDGDLDILNKPYTWDSPRVDLWLNGGTARFARPGQLRNRVGMELWTYRYQLAADLPRTLAKIAGMGFTDVETASFYGRSATEFRLFLDAAGLTCSSYIVGYDRLKKDLPGVVADARALGARYVLTAGIPHSNPMTEAEMRVAAADFNEWGAKLRDQGLQFGYHPHGFEFVRTPTGNLFDVLLQETKPELVTFELDTFWFTQGGADPLTYLQKHPGRFALVHLKDMAPGTAINVSGRAPDDASVAMGTGTHRWEPLLAAARAAGIRYYYIEDESHTSPRQVPVSLDYLKSIGF